MAGQWECGCTATEEHIGPNTHSLWGAVFAKKLQSQSCWSEIVARTLVVVIHS